MSKSLTGSILSPKGCATIVLAYIFNQQSHISYYNYITYYFAFLTASTCYSIALKIYMFRANAPSLSLHHYISSLVFITPRLRLNLRVRPELQLKV